MQRITNSSLNGALPGLTTGYTKISRLYSKLNPSNPESTKPAFRLIQHKKSFSSTAKKSKLARNNEKTTQKRSESPYNEIKIIIQSVDFTPKSQVPPNLAFLTATDISTNNSSFDSNLTSQSHKSSDNEEKKKGIKLIKRKMNKPARFLSPNDCKEITKKSGRNRVKIVDTIDLIRKIEQKDKESFINELVYSKFRKHKYTKLLPVRFDESWEWSSHGSVSPQHRVRFLDI